MNRRTLFRGGVFLTCLLLGPSLGPGVNQARSDPAADAAEVSDGGRDTVLGPAPAGRPAGNAGLVATAPFSREQAEQGAQVYAATCAVCHGQHLEGGHDVPSLNGRFVSQWADASLQQLYRYIATAMPLMAPGSLPDEQNAAVVAFLLQHNGAVPGADKFDPYAARRSEDISSMLKKR